MREHQSSTSGVTSSTKTSEPAVGKATLASADSTAGGDSMFEGAEWEAASDGGGSETSHDSAGGGSDRRTLATAARKKSSLVERLAAQGVKVLNAIGGALDSAAEKLGDAEAGKAKSELQALAKKCGPTTAGVQKKVQAKANRLNAYYLGKLLKTSFNQARKMEAACKKLRKDYKKNKIGSLLSFAKSAFDAASAMSKAAQSFRDSVDSVNQIVAQIGRACNQRLNIDIAPKIKPYVFEKPKFELEIDKRIDIIGGRSIGILGLKLIGGKKVVPKEALKIDGPAQSVPLVA